MAHIKSGPEKNMFYRLNDRLETWSERHLPDWLYKLLTLQYRAPMTPDEARKTRRFTEGLIVIALILLILSIWY